MTQLLTLIAIANMFILAMFFIKFLEENNMDKLAALFEALVFFGIMGFLLFGIPWVYFILTGELFEY